MIDKKESLLKSFPEEDDVETSRLDILKSFYDDAVRQVKEARANRDLWQGLMEKWSVKAEEYRIALDEENGLIEKIFREKTEKDLLLEQHREQVESGGGCLEITLEQAKLLDFSFSLPLEICACCKNKMPVKIVISGDEPFPIVLPCKCAGAVSLRQKAEEEYAKGKKEIQKQQEEINKKRWISESGIGLKYLTVNLNKIISKSPEQEEILKICRKFAESIKQKNHDGKGIFLYGNSGCGKTYFATALALDVINSGVPAICKTAIEIYNDLRDFGNVNTADYTAKLKSIPFLIIDDLGGKEKASTWNNSVLFELIDTRAKNGKPIFITSNYNITELERVITPEKDDGRTAKAIVSRIYGSCEVYEIFGMDVRKERARKEL